MYCDIWTVYSLKVTSAENIMVMVIGTASTYCPLSLAFLSKLLTYLLAILFHVQSPYI